VSAKVGRSLRQLITVRNRQRTRAVNTRQLHRMAKTVLLHHLRVEDFHLNIFLVGAREMTRLNEAYLRHRGSTDVLAFDYRDPARRGPLFGEIFVSVDEACSQARRFRTTWQSEVVRYIVHGLLHFCGYEDLHSKHRQKMKRVEDRLLILLSSEFSLSALSASKARIRPACARRE